MLFFRYIKELTPSYSLYFTFDKLPLRYKDRQEIKEKFTYRKGITIKSLMKELSPKEFTSFCEKHGFKVDTDTIEYFISKHKLGRFKEGKILNIEILGIDSYLKTFFMYLSLIEYLQQLKGIERFRCIAGDFEEIVKEDLKKRLNILTKERESFWDRLISFLYESYPVLYEYWSLLLTLLNNEYRGNREGWNVRIPAERHYYAVSERNSGIKKAIGRLLKQNDLDYQKINEYIDRLINRATYYSLGFHRSVLSLIITVDRKILYDTYEILKGELKYSFFLLSIADYLWHILKYILRIDRLIHPIYRYAYNGTVRAQVRKCIICGREFRIKRVDAKCCSDKECQKMYRNFIKKYFRKTGEYSS